MRRSLTVLDLIVISLYGLALSINATVLDPFVYTAKVQVLAPVGLKNTFLGIISFFGLVWAAVIQPVMGALSDRSTSRWGRRRPFLLVGTLLSLVSLTIIAASGNLWLLFLGVMLIQTTANVVQAAWQGFIPDLVPMEQRGRASSAKSIFELLANIIGPLIAGQMLGAGNVVGAVAVIGVVFVAVTVVVMVGVREEPRAEPVHDPTWAAVRNTFNVDLAGNRDFAWWLVNRFTFWCGLLALRTFLINFVKDVLGMTPEQAQSVTGNLSALLGVAVLIFVLAAGFLADAIGRRPLLIAAGVVGAVGVGVFLIARSLPVLYGAGLLVGIGAGLFITTSWTLATDLVPKTEAARYLGITNLATAGGGALARLAGPRIDGLNAVTGSLFGYYAVYGLGGLFFILSALAVLPVHGGKPASATAEPAS
jgi:Na+/melibiose symporter-like transporter